MYEKQLAALSDALDQMSCVIRRKTADIKVTMKKIVIVPPSRCVRFVLSA